MSKTRHLWLLIFALLAGTLACGPQKVGTETGNLSGDVTGPPWANTAAGLKGSALPSLASCLSAGGYLLWNGSAWTCGAGGAVAPTGTGLWYNSSGSLNGAAVTLTGDVSQGALSGGNVPLTVTAVQGKSITLATGLLEYTGSAWNFVTGASIFTPGGDLTGNATTQYVQSLSGASGSGATVTIASNVTSLQPSDNVTALGSATHRLLSSNAGPSGFNVYNGGSLPVTALSSNGLTFSVGSGSNDVKLQRGGVALAVLDNAAGGNATLEVGGGSTALSLASSTTIINVTGTGAANATSAGITFASQAVNATNGGAGNVIAQYAAATGSGAEGAFAVKRGTSTYATIQGWVSGPTSLAGLYFGVGITPSAGNHTILSDGTSSTYFNAPATMVFQIAGTSEVDLNSTTLSPAAPGGIANGSAANYWNGVYSSSFVFPAGLGATGTIGWSAAAASGAGFDTYVQAQPPMSGGTFNGGSIYLMSGGQNGGTGVQGNVVASIGANTSHLWSPNAKGTFQVIDGSGLNFVAANYAAVSSGTATLSALWLGAGSTGFTPSNTNYAAKSDGASLWLNGPTTGINFDIANTNYLTLTTTALVAATNLLLQPAASDYVGIRDTNSTRWASYPTVLSGGSAITLPSPASGQSNFSAQYVVNLTTTTSSLTTAFTISTPNTASVYASYLVEIRWTSKGSSGKPNCGGRMTFQLGQQGTSTDSYTQLENLVGPATSDAISASMTTPTVTVSATSASSGTNNYWEFYITVVQD